MRVVNRTAISLVGARPYVEWTRGRDADAAKGTLTVGMSHALYDVVTLRPMTFVLVMGMLGALAALAGYIPAHRAARVDPMVALRHE